MKNRKDKLIESISKYLKENAEASKELCGEDDEINYLPAKKALDDFNELKEMIEVKA